MSIYSQIKALRSATFETEPESEIEAPEAEIPTQNIYSNIKALRSEPIVKPITPPDAPAITTPSPATRESSCSQ